MDETFILRFLVSNGFLAVFLSGILLIKKIASRKLTTRDQYRISLTAFISLAAPFLPVGYSGFEFMWDRTMGTGGSSNMDTSAGLGGQVPPDGNTWLQDFAVGLDIAPLSVILHILTVFLFVGMVAMLTVTMLQNRRLRQMKRGLASVEDKNTVDIFRGCRKEVGCRIPVKLYCSPEVKTPMTFRLLRPIIVVPSDISYGDDAAIRSAMLHELCHCKRGDMLVNYLTVLSRIVFWFNPAVWIFLSNLKQEMEQNCDRSVLQILGDDDSIVRYGETILRYASGQRGKADLQIASGIGGSYSQLTVRMKKIAGYHADSKRKKAASFIVFLFVLLTTIAFVPSFSALAGENDRISLSGREIVQADYSSLFSGYTGSFVLYEPLDKTYIVYNEAEAATRRSPYSTYKIFSALQALESGELTPENTQMEWDGTGFTFEEWNRGQQLGSALSHSVSWYFQALDRSAGVSGLEEFYRRIGYGNQRIGWNTDAFWMNGNLKISPVEQVDLLEKLYNNAFGFDLDNIRVVKNAIFLEESEKDKVYGKTGSGMANDETPAAGWFIGYIEYEGHVAFFATQIQGDGASGSSAAQIAFSIFKERGLYAID